MPRAPTSTSPTAMPITFDEAAAAINERADWQVQFFARGQIRTANRPSVDGSTLRLLNLRGADGTGPVLALTWSTPLTKSRITMAPIDDNGGVEIRWPNGTWLKLTKS